MSQFTSLEEWGWKDPFKSDFEARGISGELPSRVVEEQRGAYVVQAESGEFVGTISGKMRHSAKNRLDFPGVGDWVTIKIRPVEKTATILSILPRRSKLSRKVAGRETEEQLIAANLDTVFVVTALTQELDTRKLERFLALVAESGVAAVVLLNKADLCDDPNAAALRLQVSAFKVPVHVVSAVSGLGLSALSPYLNKGETIAFIGSSGVGKSTLINRLTGSQRQKVQEVRKEDHEGRHTTTSRRLIPLPSGGLLIDTPGMRELQLWDTQGIADAFSDVIALIAACRFQDCRHHTDAGCAVQAAIQEGRLPADRYAHYTRLGKESEDLALKREAEARSQGNEKIKKARAEYKREAKRARKQNRP